MNGHWDSSDGLLAALAALEQDNNDVFKNETSNGYKTQKKVKLIPPKKVRDKLEWFNANFKIRNIFLEVLGNLHN